MASATETFQGCWGKKALNILRKIWVLLLLGLIVAVIWSEPEAVICPTCMGFVPTQTDKVSSMDKSICQGVSGRIRSVKLAWNSVKLAWTTVFKREPPFFSVNHGFPKTRIFCVLFAIYSFQTFFIVNFHERDICCVNITGLDRRWVDQEQI